MLVDFFLFLIVEDGNSFEENVLKKVQVVVLVFNLLVVVDDLGLMVDVLDGEFGIYLVCYVGDYNDVVNN